MSHNGLSHYYNYVKLSFVITAINN